MDISVLEYGSALAQAIAAVRLMRLNAVRQYRWFLIFLLVSVSRTLLLKQLPLRSDAYARAWMLTQIPVSGAYLMAALEVYNRSMAAYPVLGSAGRWILGIGGGLALAINLALIPRESGLVGYAAVLQWMFVFRRVTAGVVVMFMLLVALALARLYVPASRNTVRHRRLLTAYCALVAAQQFGVNLLGREVLRVADVAFLGLGIILFAVWAVALNRDGELPPARPTSEQADEAEREVAEMLQMVRTIRPGE